MHRVVWDPESDRDRARVATDEDADDAAMSRATGTFTVRLTVGTRSLTRQFTVKPDPRTV